MSEIREHRKFVPPKNCQKTLIAPKRLETKKAIASLFVHKLLVFHHKNLHHKLHINVNCLKCDKLSNFYFVTILFLLFIN